MPKFFVPKENIRGGDIVITGGDAAHISRVLRMGAGDRLNLCDGGGRDYEAEISKVEKEEILCRVISVSENDTEPNIDVTLFQGIPKGAKMEYIIQKTTELGIKRIVPCRMSRCVAKIEGKKKTERWQKIAEAAAKQSGRGKIPQILAPTDLDDALSELKKCDIAFAPYECEEKTTLRETLLSVEAPKSIGFIIGPEGGFSLEEADKLKAAGIKTVTLGKRILRTETAGEAVLAMIMYEKGDVNL